LITNRSNITKITVTTAKESYPIHIGRGLEGPLATQIKELVDTGSKVAVVTDVAVRSALASFFDASLDGLPILEVPSGETSKRMAQFESVLDFLAEEGLDRGGVVVAVGGGVIGDLTGYAAASWLRGVRFIQVPTTLLSMVDSSVGGKTGINIAAGKNLVGAFHQPIAVYEDLNLLKTLPPREFAAGMAEVMKYGMLADLELFEMLETVPLLNWEDERLASVVQRNCQTKANVVNADEKELSSSGGRALLNLGHTFGHAIENVAGYGEYLHGEAIAIGFVAAAKLSEYYGYISANDTDRVIRMVEAHGLPSSLRSPLAIEALFSAMRKDKKVRAGSLRFVVMDAIGLAATKDDVAMDVVDRIWRDVGASD
jgi:3-dehydroquinate synthase|tara:strand:+ start:1504 stop:2613 length:1110 start_codon:yes stop_codon:yes gene_type:complete